MNLNVYGFIFMPLICMYHFKLWKAIGVKNIDSMDGFDRLDRPSILILIMKNVVHQQTFISTLHAYMFLQRISFPYLSMSKELISAVILVVNHEQILGILLKCRAQICAQQMIFSKWKLDDLVKNPQQRDWKSQDHGKQKSQWKSMTSIAESSLCWNYNDHGFHLVRKRMKWKE